MRLVGQNSFFNLRGFRLGLLLAASTFLAAPLLGQTAPYVLPYTMSTFAGPHAAYSVGAPCTNTNVTPNVTDPVLVALDTIGDGCLASQLEIGVDPHDIRVDGKGNVYWLDDNGSYGVIHKIAASTLLETTYVGNVTKTKTCSVGDKYGDGCAATDGAASTGTLGYTTTGLAKGRGIAVSRYGDLFYADYNGDEDHKVSAATGLFTTIAGNLAVGSADGIAGSNTTSAVNGSRGIGVDSNTGLVYVADTTNNVLRLLTPVSSSLCTVGVYTCYQSSTISAANPTPTPNLVVSGVPIGSEQLDAPEDAQVDGNSNIFFTEQANGVVMGIYGGTGPFFGIPSPTKGYVYNIAGNPVPLATTAGTLNTSYPADGTTPTVLATTVSISTRKMSVDAHGDLFIADSSNNVVWFVDHTTGYLRLVAGHFDPTAVPTPPAVAPVPPPSSIPIGCSASTDAVGDGCPGAQASLYDSSDMGNAADDQGNLYITDAEGAVATSARIRKLLSGLNFPATAIGSTITQTVAIHFAVSDSAAATNAFTIATSDFSVGTPSCKVNTDLTTDCLVPVTFTPSKPGYDTATLAIASLKGAVNTYLVTGTGTTPSLAFDPGSAAVVAASTSNPQGVVFDGVGNAYVADSANNRVLMIAAGGAVTTFAGTGTQGLTGNGGQATAATLNAPTAVAIDTAGSVFIADTGNNVIRKVASNGIITTYAGGATSVSCPSQIDALGNGCLATSATFSHPSGLATDNKGQLYVADTGNNLIRQINVYGYVSVFAGGATSTTTCSAQTDTFGDGCPAAQSTFSAPTGLAFNATGNTLLVSDTGDNIVRQISLSSNISVGSAGAVTAVQANPISLVAGNGSAGSSIDVNSVAKLSQLNQPIGVAVDAAQNVYIADSGNDAIRFVSKASGTISTIVGINAASGTGTVPGPATGVQLTLPAGVAVTNTGLLYVTDSGNNRILSDARTQPSFNFGRINLGASSPVQTFTESSIGTTAATLASPLVTSTGNTTQFTFTASTSSAGCATGSLAPGATCTFQGQFTPQTTGPFSATYTEATTSAGGAASVTLVGTGAVLTPTTGTVAQTAPATGNSQFGGSVTLGVTVAAVCNIAAPTCYPTGKVQLIVDTVSQSPLTLSGTGTASQSFTGLSVGPHTISCSYSGDNFYAASTCTPVTITVAPASTTSLLAATNNNQPQFQFNATSTTACPPITASGATKGDAQCPATTLNATVVSNTTGIPTGTVTFYVTGGAFGSTPTLLGSSPLNSSTGTASYTLYYVVDANGDIVSDASLPPGTYTLTCSYSGASNFAASNCAPVTYTVTASPVGFTLTPVGCVYNDLYIPGTNTAGQGITCQPVAQQSLSGAPLVATADGSTSDVTIFVKPTDSFSGTVTFSCSGLPTYSVCTFSPTSLTFAAGTTYAGPVSTDMTLWTDIQPGTVPTAALHAPTIGPNSRSGVQLAMIYGWPFTLLGLFGLLRFRRKHGALRGLAIVGLIMLMAGSSLIFTGCAGPGAYQPVLTPAGTYPITVTVKGNGITQTTLVYFKVASPGITGQQ